MVGVSVVSLVLCCALAWWQWERFSSASGTFQNLGYVLQWPLFGLFPAFVFWRMHKLKRQAELARDVEGEAQQEPPRTAQAAPDAHPAGEDDELAAYNRYLAELNARDQQAR